MPKRLWARRGSDDATILSSRWWITLTASQCCRISRRSTRAWTIRLKATLAEVRALIAEERRHFDAHLEGRLKDTFADVRILVAEEGVTTRRHFEMMGADVGSHEAACRRRRASFDGARRSRVSEWHGSQEITVRDDGSILTQLCLCNDRPLRTWILGFGGVARSSRRRLSPARFLKKPR
jgi:hypothetical protein